MLANSPHPRAVGALGFRNSARVSRGYTSEPELGGVFGVGPCCSKSRRYRP